MQAFIDTFGLEKECGSVDELAEMPDIGFIQGVNWSRHLEYVEPFFRRDKPVFIDKPVVGSLRDCDRLVKYAADGNVILGGSSLRYAPEISEFIERPPAERGTILHAYGTCGVDEFNYATHIVENISTLMEDGTFLLDDAFYRESGGIFETSRWYRSLFG